MDEYQIASLVLGSGALIVGILSARTALKQQRHMQITRDAEFMRNFDESLVTDAHEKARRMIYNAIPYPHRLRNSCLRRELPVKELAVGEAYRLMGILCPV
jgi:hypothetical protein